MTDADRIAAAVDDELRRVYRAFDAAPITLTGRRWTAARAGGGYYYGFGQFTIGITEVVVVQGEDGPAVRPARDWI